MTWDRDAAWARGRAESESWGPWRLSLDDLCFHHPMGYYVDLERCLDSADILDWLCQVASKTWADDETVAGLVRAINMTLYPQSCICSFGESKAITVGDALRSAQQAARRWPEKTIEVGDFGPRWDELAR